MGDGRVDGQFERFGIHPGNHQNVLARVVAGYAGNQSIGVELW